MTDLLFVLLYQAVLRDHIMAGIEQRRVRIAAFARRLLSR
jgi:hypothetical protein